MTPKAKSPPLAFFWATLYRGVIHFRPHSTTPTLTSPRGITSVGVGVVECGLFVTRL